MIGRRGCQCCSRCQLLRRPLAGGTAGAGVAIGLWFQPTTANIHSGYSFASVGEWVVLAATGGTLGCVVAALAAWRIAVPHVLAAVAVALAVVGAVGWLWSASRDTIDCDDRPNVCAARYGLDEHDGRSSVALAPDLV